MNILTWLIIGIVVVILGYLVSIYNGLIALKTRAQNAEKAIDLELNKRYELIPNLIEAVKGYMKHEKKTLEQVTAARSGLNQGSIQDKVASNNMLADTLKSLFAVAESYPDLKANEQFLDLQNQLTTTQENILSSQKYYNAYVQQYDETVQKFPTNLVAGILGFHEKDFEYLNIDEKNKENVKVDFSEEEK